MILRNPFERRRRRRELVIDLQAEENGESCVGGCSMVLPGMDYNERLQIKSAVQINNTTVQLAF